MKESFLLVALLSISLNVFSATQSGNQTIRQVEVTEDFFTIYVNGTLSTDNCEGTTKVVFWRNDYPNAYEHYLSTALAAFTAKKQISMWLNGCKNGPWGKSLAVPGSLVIKE
ncbi:hypothetical protein [Pleionea litopenaei]|uniref:KTSC domain-containing protein n=1 Tax=Pleionea litopenaei TaxID=3070815 RepID=A0AA51RWG0_9GAMM|nr:hypothetical protein [Pleionea sp. HL-JVS1]WMS88759.1 hypothetical protein Q9312_07530 [Pleionea sp. HL-JVS1]